ncbi:hypothetical protein Ade02nite_23530 [Paractinoplanes deccanensis]|uniref:Transcriptional regulator n=1 Tax=Paractinoplanes deccanensis TaxID=113561 RepID=A0ABQ3Y155_9ACTN|nr:hypothetical protein [Actinoplanes deccanensis]GID73712.1 hypothetical protein Ade02nite_23530 [Actinoplanes deccanensis]
MNSYNRNERTLTLLGRRGAYELLLALSVRDGSAAFSELEKEAPQVMPLLRALITEGFVTSAGPGTLDLEPGAELRFSLTAKGQAVTAHLVRIQQWLAERPPQPHIGRLH